MSITMSQEISGNSRRHRHLRSNSRLPRPTSTLQINRTGQNNGSAGPSFFPSASDVEISGGTFTNQVAPQTTVQLNIYQAKPGQSLTHHANLANSLQNAEQRRSQGNNGIESDIDEGLDYVRPLTPSPSNITSNIGRGSNFNDTVAVAQTIRRNIPEIYKDLLGCRNYGTPLWIPSANLQAPPQYRVRGVSIADVGVFTPEGGFDQLYNASLPADDPINSGGVPENYVPLQPSFSRHDIRKFREFSSGSYLASSLVSVTTEEIGGHTSAITFESSASEGAVLVMPQGAHVEELNNIGRLQSYIARNAENVYRLANDTLGRNIKNGELSFVYGSRKATTFGLATFSDPPADYNTQLRFTFGSERDTSPGGFIGPGHRWSYRGAAVVKIGPESDENRGLETEDGSAPRNQTLFVSTISVKLDDAVWRNLEAGKTGMLDSHAEHASGFNYPNVLDGTQGVSESRNSSNQSENRDPGGTRCSLNVCMATNPPNSGYSLCRRGTVDPREILHTFLLDKVPRAKMSLVSDRDYPSDWNVVDPHHDPSVLIDKVCSLNNICERDGAVYFELKEVAKDTADQNINDVTSSIVNGNLTVEAYLFGNTNSKDDRSDGLVHLIGTIQAFDCAPNQLTTTHRTEALEGHPQRPFSLDEIATRSNGSTTSSSIAELRDVLQRSYSTPNACNLLCMQRLADYLAMRYLHLRQVEDLHEAIWYYEVLLPFLPIDHYCYLELLLNLSSALYQRLQLLHQINDRDRLVKCLRAQCQLDFTEILLPFKTALGISPSLRQNLNKRKIFRFAMNEDDDDDDETENSASLLSSVTFVQPSSSSVTSYSAVHRYAVPNINTSGNPTRVSSPVESLIKHQRPTKNYVPQQTPACTSDVQCDDANNRPVRCHDSNTPHTEAKLSPNQQLQALQHQWQQQQYQQKLREPLSFEKLPTESFQELAKARAQRVGLLTMLMNPGPDVVIAYAKRGHSSGEIGVHKTVGSADGVNAKGVGGTRAIQSMAALVPPSALAPERVQQQWRTPLRPPRPRPPRPPFQPLMQTPAPVAPEPVLTPRSALALRRTEDTLTENNLTESPPNATPSADDVSMKRTPSYELLPRMIIAPSSMSILAPFDMLGRVWGLMTRKSIAAEPQVTPTLVENAGGGHAGANTSSGVNLDSGTIFHGGSNNKINDSTNDRTSTRANANTLPQGQPPAASSAKGSHGQASFDKEYEFVDEYEAVDEEYEVMEEYEVTDKEHKISDKEYEFVDNPEDKKANQHPSIDKGKGKIKVDCQDCGESGFDQPQQKPPQSNQEGTASKTELLPQEQLHVKQPHISQPLPIPVLEYPYNLPPAPSPLTPRTTRRRMLEQEMSESLRRNLLWERQVNRVNGTGARRTASTDATGNARQEEGSSRRPLTAVQSMVRLHSRGTLEATEQQQKESPEESTQRGAAWNNAWGDNYHVSGW